MLFLREEKKSSNKSFCGDDGGGGIDGSCGGVFGEISFRTNVWASLPASSSSDVFERASLPEIYEQGWQSGMHPPIPTYLTPTPLPGALAPFPTNPLPG